MVVSQGRYEASVFHGGNVAKLRLAAVGGRCFGLVPLPAAWWIVKNRHRQTESQHRLSNIPKLQEWGSANFSSRRRPDVWHDAACHDVGDVVGWLGWVRLKPLGLLHFAGACTPSEIAGTP